MASIKQKDNFTFIFLLTLTIFVILSFFGYNSKNIFTTDRIYIGSQNYTCKEKVSARLESSESCKEVMRLAIKKGNLFSAKLPECEAQFSITETATTRSTSIYELWYKFLNVVYSKKEIPVETNFSGAYDCVIDTK